LVGRRGGNAAMPTASAALFYFTSVSSPPEVLCSIATKDSWILKNSIHASQISLQAKLPNVIKRTKIINSNSPAIIKTKIPMVRNTAPKEYTYLIKEIIMGKGKDSKKQLKKHLLKLQKKREQRKN